jgi:hypothetical protein
MFSLTKPKVEPPFPDKALVEPALEGVFNRYVDNSRIIVSPNNGPVQGSAVSPDSGGGGQRGDLDAKE